VASNCHGLTLRTQQYVTAVRYISTHNTRSILFLGASNPRGASLSADCYRSGHTAQKSTISSFARSCTTPPPRNWVCYPHYCSFVYAFNVLRIQ